MSSLKKQIKYKLGDRVSFFYYYEDKIGVVVEADKLGLKYIILQTSNNTKYPVDVIKIHGKVIENDIKTDN